MALLRPAQIFSPELTRDLFTEVLEPEETQEALSKRSRSRKVFDKNGLTLDAGCEAMRDILFTGEPGDKLKVVDKILAVNEILGEDNKGSRDISVAISFKNSDVDGTLALGILIPR